MRGTTKWLATVTAAVALGGAVAAPASAQAEASTSTSACTLTMGNVGYSANMLYVSGWLSGGCTGQVAIDLQRSTSADGPWTTVDSGITYPLGPDAEGGTAWFDNLDGCGGFYYYRGVGTYGDLTGVSPRPQHPC
jgi:hypothetical protein